MDTFMYLANIHGLTIDNTARIVLVYKLR